MRIFLTQKNQNKTIYIAMKTKMYKIKNLTYIMFKTLQINIIAISENIKNKFKESKTRMINSNQHKQKCFMMLH